MPIPFRAELTAFLDEFAGDHPGVRRGKMFGLPAIYVGRRLATCLMEDGIAIRLPTETARREVQTRRATPISAKQRETGSWVLYRPRTVVAARRLAPILEAAIRHIAERQTEEITGIRLTRRVRSR